MKNVTTKKVYKVTLECKAINSWAKQDGITFGLKCMDESFNVFMKVLSNQKRNPWGIEPSKSRKVSVELLEASE